MQSTAPALDWGKIVTRGVVAGIVGAVAIALATYVLYALPNHITLAGVFLTDAAYVHSDNALVGALAHLLVSIGWGLGFSYAAATLPNVDAHPWLSGLVYGAIVWLLMQFVLMLGAVWPGLTPVAFAYQIVFHTLFFGVPVALTTRAMSRS